MVRVRVRVRVRVELQRRGHLLEPLLERGERGGRERRLRGGGGALHAARRRDAVRREPLDLRDEARLQQQQVSK